MSHADATVNITLENEVAEPLLEAQIGLMLTRAAAILRRWMAAESTDGPAALAPNAIVKFGPDLAERFATTPAAEAPAELIEAARTICTFEDEQAGSEQQARRPRPGDRYRHRDITGRVVEVESLLNVGPNTSVEFIGVEGSAGLVPSGFTRSMPLERFLGEHEPDAPDEVGRLDGTGR